MRKNGILKLLLPPQTENGGSARAVGNGDIAKYAPNEHPVRWSRQDARVPVAGFVPEAAATDPEDRGLDESKLAHHVGCA